MLNFFFLLFAHFLADLPLQGQWIAENKGKEPLFMFGHVVIWTGCISLALLAIHGQIEMWELIFLFLGHYIADYSKCKYVENLCYTQDNKLTNISAKLAREAVYLDQAFHLFQLIIVYLF